MSMRPSGIYSTNYTQDQALFRTRVDFFWTFVIAAIMVIIPLLSSAGPFGSTLVPISVLGTFTSGGILLISITGLNLLLGYTGQISLGQAVFMMVGAYTTTILTKDFDVPFLISLPASALFTGAIGIIFGLASLRVKGFYLAMSTLAAHYIIRWAVTTYEGERTYNALKFLGDNFFTRFFRDLNLGGEVGFNNVPAAEIFGLTLNDKLEAYYLVLVCVIISATFARNLIRSRVGRAWISIRDNDLAAEQLGINVFRYKLIAFFMSAVYAGLAGALLAHVNRVVSPDEFDLIKAIEQLGMLVIGGVGFALGPLFGVAFFILMERYLINYAKNIFVDVIPRIIDVGEKAQFEVGLSAGLRPLLFGLFLWIFLIYQPRGIAYRWLILQAAWRLRPFTKI